MEMTEARTGEVWRKGGGWLYPLHFLKLKRRAADPDKFMASLVMSASFSSLLVLRAPLGLPLPLLITPQTLIKSCGGARSAAKRVASKIGTRDSAARDKAKRGGGPIHGRGRRLASLRPEDVGCNSQTATFDR